MIISASRRTDIPALYCDWLLKRLRERFVFVRNPINAHQISKIDLSPNLVDCIVFWTKDGDEISRRLRSLEPYLYYFQYTINNYGISLEPSVPDLEQQIESFRRISRAIGKSRVIWRYDPIVITNRFTTEWHVRNFQLICSKLADYTSKIVISFVDYYPKTTRNMKSFAHIDPTLNEMFEIASELSHIANDHSMVIETCAEKINLNKIGIRHGKCIDDKLIEEIVGCEISANKDKNQREECGCIASIDIGAYDTCTNGCKYCYANCNHAKATRQYREHDPQSPLLYGEVRPEDKVTERKVASCLQVQADLFKQKATEYGELYDSVKGKKRKQ